MNIEIIDNGLFGVKVLVSDRLHTGIKVSVAVTERVTTKILGYTEQLSAYYTWAYDVDRWLSRLG